jgi:DNA polymerase-3 subunit gamma/tau
VALISARLAHILAAEQLVYEPAALQLLAQAADGSMRDALSLLDQLLAFGDGAAREAEARTMLGAVTRDHVERIAALLASGAAPALLGAAEALDEFAPDYGQILDQLAALLERIALQQLLPEYAGDDLFPIAVVRDLAARISREDVQLYYQTAILGRRDLALAPEPRTGFRMTLIRMLAFRPEGPALNVAGAPATTAAPAAMGAPVAMGAPTASSAPVPSAAAEAPPPSEWTSLVAALELDGPTRMLALNCALLARSAGLIRLTLDPHNATAHTRAREQRLAQALSRHLGETVRVEIVTGGAAVQTPAQAEDRAAQQALAVARAALAADPTVQALQQRFGATVNSESVRPRKPA